MRVLAAWILSLAAGEEVALLQTRRDLTDRPLEGQHALLAALDPSRCNLFTLWDYKDNNDFPLAPPISARLMVESWRRHAGDLCNEPVLIDDDNVKLYIPDLPEEYFKLPYPAAKSDMIRYGVIHHWGGLYLDTDVLARKDLTSVVALLKDHDLVAYQTDSPEHNFQTHGHELKEFSNHSCTRKYSSNIMGGRKGSAYFAKVWEQQKKALSAHCPEMSKNDIEKDNKICCFDKSDVLCHIPWAYLGEHLSHNIFDEMGHTVNTRCFSESESFVPNRLGVALRKSLKDALATFRESKVNGPLDRIMYHLFNSVSGLSQLSCKDFKDGNKFMSHLIGSSFATGAGRRGLGKSRSGATQEWLRQYPYFEAFGDASFDGKIPCE